MYIKGKFKYILHIFRIIYNRKVIPLPSRTFTLFVQDFEYDNVTIQIYDTFTGVNMDLCFPKNL